MDVLNRLETWLATWKDIGYMLRVRGFDYVIAEYKFNPGSEPKNIDECLERTFNANLALLELFADLPSLGTSGDEKINACIEKLHLLQTSIKNLIAERGNGCNQN